jgi:hypothetical protein
VQAAQRSAQLCMHARHGRARDSEASLRVDVAADAVLHQTRPCYRSPCDLFVRPCRAYGLTRPHRSLLTCHLSLSGARVGVSVASLSPSLLWFALCSRSICASRAFTVPLACSKKGKCSSPHRHTTAPFARCLCYCAPLTAANNCCSPDSVYLLRFCTIFRPRHPYSTSSPPLNRSLPRSP